MLDRNNNRILEFNLREQEILNYPVTPSKFEAIQ